MGVRVLHDPEAGKAVLYDSVSETTLAPIFGELFIEPEVALDPVQNATTFAAWVEETTGLDPRRILPGYLIQLYDWWTGALQEGRFSWPEGEETPTIFGQRPDHR